MPRSDFTDKEKKETDKGWNFWTCTVAYVRFWSKDHAHQWSNHWRNGTDCYLHLAGFECACSRIISEHRHLLYLDVHPSYPLR